VNSPRSTRDVPELPQPPDGYQASPPEQPIGKPWASRPRRFGRPGWFGRPHRFTTSATLAPVAAGIAVVLSSTALVGVLQGYRWLWIVLVVVGLVVLLGLVLRLVRTPPVAVVAAQLVGLLLLLTGLFSEHAVLWVLPAPTALIELTAKLSTAIGVIENGIPPVPTTSAMALLVAVSFGLAAVATDALAVAGDGPAACGLVLLGAYTVPTALTPQPLPAWTLMVGAAGYALVLLAEYRRRQARRGVSSGLSATPAASPARRALAQLRTATTASGAPVAVALTAIAVAVALGAGAVLTFVGTEGRFSGTGQGGSDGSDGQLGLNPFTSLRGQLQRDEPSELLRVRGLAEPEYLRALTLNRYVPQQGWQLPDRYHGVNLDKTLPSGLPIPVNNPTAVMQVENIKYRDQWLPLVGQPMGVTGVTPGRWRYDTLSGTAFTETPVREPSWIERAALPDPPIKVLQSSPPATDVNPAYLDTGGVDHRIALLAAGITKHASSPFERAVVLNRYFLEPANGFRYSLRTKPGNTGDALLDFLTRGKTGYCEQYASAMAVMLRTVGVPSRVAIGFTAGNRVGDYRSVRTSDAHAWVEAYFTGLGWLTFDPTPLRDGRSVLPSYVANAPEVPMEPPPPSALGADPRQQEDTQPPSPTPPPPPEGQDPRAQPDQAQPGPNGAEPDQSQQDQAQPFQPQPDQTQSGGLPSGDQGAGGKGFDTKEDGAGGEDQRKDQDGPLGAKLGAAARLVLLIGLGLLALAALATIPSAVRGSLRRSRLARVASGGPEGAVAAWRELLAEFVDRGGQPLGNDTVRATAAELAKTHRLDNDAIQAMRTVVGAVERSWYAKQGDPGPGRKLVAAVSSVRSGLDRSAPLGLIGRLWPRSVRPRSHR
jgi:transglutaminase-like putative cysteine protease